MGKNKLTIENAVTKAVREHDYTLAGKIVDTLRIRWGYTYDRAFQLFNRFTGISKPNFETLMYEADKEL